jgi:hypothetical protein
MDALIDRRCRAADQLLARRVLLRGHKGHKGRPDQPVQRDLQDKAPGSGVAGPPGLPGPRGPDGAGGGPAACRVRLVRQALRVRPACTHSARPRVTPSAICSPGEKLVSVTCPGGAVHIEENCRL